MVEGGEMIDPTPTISLMVEIPEDLFNGMREYLGTHPDWDQDRAFTAALSLLLLQNPGTFQKRASRIYLDTLFARGMPIPETLFKRDRD